MIYYVFNIAIMLVLFFLTERNTSLRNGKKAFCILASLQWILFVGLRNYEVFTDNLMYLSRFTSESIMPLASLIPDHFTLSGGWGFSVLIRLCALVGMDHRLFLIVLAAVYIGALGVMIYRYSADSFISFLVYATLMIFTTLCPLRQSVGIAFAGIIGYKFVKERKPLHFALCVVLGIVFHPSAIVAAPLYFIDQWKLLAARPRLLALILFAEFAFVLLAPGFSRGLVTLMSGDDYEYYSTHTYVGANTWLFIAMYFALLALCLWRSKDYDEIGTHGLIGLMLICMILPFALINSNVVRLTYYYMPLVTLLMPAFFRTFDRAWGAAFKLGFFAAFLVAGVVFTAARAGMNNYVPVIFT